MYNAFAAWGGTLNSRRAASPLVRLVEVEEMWEAFDHSQGILPQNWGGTEPNCSVTSMVLKAKANNTHTGLALKIRSAKDLALSHDEFRKPRSNVTVDQVV
ncbi:uncharacterized protein TNCV_3749331 [Trichonephila clavipes]|nr:uncharacterized protein TNCV_3749331 [Trichonephila clavipes]